ncbi:MAG TPA: ABC transporter substrate-binding protein [Burkholderiaceae bacterium]|nr:ABC transporter substrate-binding protein [Burkholderiaceae bacterium]
MSIRSVRAALAFGAGILSIALAGAALAQTTSAVAPWDQVVAKARRQTVHWNAWAGDERTNAFIAWVGEEVKARYGVTVDHVRLKDTSEAVTRVVAERAAGRETDGTVDLIWINGPNFLSLKTQKLLYGPFAAALPNFKYVDTVNKRSNVIDFTTPVDGFAAPWRMAQIVFVYDSARIKDAQTLPRSARDLVPWARAHPGRTTHPNVRNFLGSTFLKQALYELAPDPAVLQRPVADQDFDRVAAPLWDWYDTLRPNLWRQGRQFPENGPAQRELMNDGEIDLMISFNPLEAAVAIANGLLQPTARTFVFDGGSIGNTSFVAIPFNSPNKEGALVVANFLLEPATQARAQDIRNMGSFNVLDPGRLSPAQRALFDVLTPSPALPTAAELGKPLLEPHASWMTRITAEWERRYTK